MFRLFKVILPVVALPYYSRKMNQVTDTSVKSVGGKGLAKKSGIDGY